MAGLSVLLEPHGKSRPGGKAVAAAQIISKATLVIHGGGASHKQPQVPVAATAAGSFFLQRCCLCHRELAQGMDIYMYRGDRAFCSEDCRWRHISMEEDALSSYGNGAGVGPAAAAAATVRSSRRVVSPTERGQIAKVFSPGVGQTER